MELSKAEKEKFDMAQSLLRLTSEPAWREMTEALLAGEAAELFKLEMYLENEQHPDREEVMAMCLRWYGVRQNRKILLRNIEEAKSYKHDLGNALLKEFAENPTQPVPDDLKELLLGVL